MEVNSHDNALTTSDTGADFDLQSITTHEAGHFLGLAHSASASATMFPAYQEHDTGLRSLDPDDISGICAIYPAGAPIPATCDTTPRHGFSALCGSEQADAASGCACRIGEGPLPTSAAGIVAAMAALGGAARRRSRARRQRDRAREGAPADDDPPRAPLVLPARTAAEVEQIAARCRRAPRIAVDVEANGLFVYRARLCTVQLAWEEGDEIAVAVVDTLAASVKPLAAIFGPDGPVKVLHDLTFDARLLDESGAPLARVRDTSVAARFLGFQATGLASLLASELGVSIDKHLQQHDWSRRPLTDEQLVYLAGDVRDLLALDDHLTEKARAREIEDEIAEECQYKLGTAKNPPRDGRPGYVRIKGALLLDPVGRAVLRRLCRVREEAAEAADVPPFKVVGNETLLAIAAKRPASTAALHALPGGASGRAGRSARRSCRRSRPGRSTATCPRTSAPRSSRRAPIASRWRSGARSRPGSAPFAAPRPSCAGSTSRSSSPGTARRSSPTRCWRTRAAAPISPSRWGASRPRRLPDRTLRRGLRDARRGSSGAAAAAGMTSPEVLIVAGEASGDRIAALAARALAARGASLYGLGGPACRAAGVSLVADGSRLGAMGLRDVAARLPALASAVIRLLARARRRPPRAALLVNATELNQRLGPLLRRLGARVLWCVAPQVWAWRPGRIEALRGACDRLAVILPFRAALWRRAGYDARYVGHPSLDLQRRSRAEVRAALGIETEAGARALAVLPGSRRGEVARLAAPLCDAAARLVRAGAVSTARVIVASGAEAGARALAVESADRAGIPVIEGDPDHGAAPFLGAFEASLCASGTASLEAALAGAAPVVTYRLDRLSFAVARRLVRTPHIALPNVLLERRAYPELLQDEVTPRGSPRPRRACSTGRARATPRRASSRSGWRSPDRRASASASRRPWKTG